MGAAKALVGRADDLVGAEQLLDAVGAPAHDARHGKQRGVQFHGDAQHLVHKAAVKVHVGADALEDLALLRDKLRCHPLDAGVEGKILIPSLFVGQLLHIALEHHLARVAQGVDGVTHAVDQTLAVKGLAVEQLFQVGFQLLVVLKVVEVVPDVLHHVHDHQVCTAVARALEGAQRRRHGRVGVGAGGGDHAGGKGGVVAAAVLGVQQQCHIQHTGFQLGVLHVRPQHPQEILGGGQLRVGPMDVHAAVLFVVVVGVVGVHRQHGEDAGQLDALAHGYFPIPAEFMPNNEAFILTVHGNSMVNIGILDGDMIIVERKSTASNGEIVVALVADEASSEPAATVKRFYKEDGYIRLQPENDTMEPLIVNDCEIIGKVIGVYRKMM